LRNEKYLQHPLANEFPKERVKFVLTPFRSENKYKTHVDFIALALAKMTVKGRKCIHTCG